MTDTVADRPFPLTSFAMNAPEFFFTELDESLRPKGSRDPLGFELVWSQVGRRLVGNLTTVTRHLDNFILTLLGFALAAQVDAAEERAPDSASPAFYARFERFEQLAAWSRYWSGREGVIGTRMMSARDQERGRDGKDGSVVVGQGAAARILGDQRRSGLWGLYSSALVGTGLMRASRLLTDDGKRLVAPFLEAYRGDAMRAFAATLEAPGKTIHIPPGTLPSIAPLLDCPGRRQLGDALLGDGAAELQKALCAFAGQGGLPESGGVQKLVLRLAQPDAGVPQPLQAYAAKVMQLERVLVAVAAAFGFLMGQHSQPMTTVVKVFENKGWAADGAFDDLDVPDFQPPFSGAWLRRAKALRAMAGYLRERQLENFVEALLELHAGVMKERGGPAWVGRSERGCLQVIMGAGAPLPAAGTLRAHWDNDYFLGAFVALWRQTYAAAREAA
ncbi:hypothetical protein [Cupriavidus sp. 8B]